MTNNIAHTPRRQLKYRTAAILLCAPLLLDPIFAQDAPAQKPLLSSQTGAKPNLMIALDNSGSMAFPYHESYGILSDSNTQFEIRRCPNNMWSDLTGSWVQGGIADFNNNHRCIYQYGNSYFYSTSSAIAYTPKKYISGSWSAQRSADVNPIYYNPRITYLPRVDASGNPLEPNDNIKFVSNQSSTNFEYHVYRNNSDHSKIRTTHSMFASNPSVTPGWTEVYKISYSYRIPQHTTYTNPNNTTPGFTYSYCNSITTVLGQQVGCSSWTDVTVKYGATGNITLPADHKRTDPGCNSTSCSVAAEIKNILTWFRYYSFRAPAVATAIGQALANNQYDKKLRLGYISINERNNTSYQGISHTPGVTINSKGLLRGVRLHNLGGNDTQEIYTWLYDQDGTNNGNSNSGADKTFNSSANRKFSPLGGTPLHNTLDRIADYYRVNQPDAKENPWSKNPAERENTTNQEMSCRRSYTLLFSDGAWNSNTSTTDKDYDNIDGLNTFSRTGTTETFRYLRQGINTEAGRKQYVPYPGSGTNGLADLTAKYYWHEDLRHSLANEVLTGPGQPAFWQNMTTYTVGYMIRPSGEVAGATSGLTFDQIDKYQREYATNGYAGATKPSWPTGNLNTASDDQKRIDDFIHAGYTGGGAGFSAQSAEDVRGIFDTVLSAIVNASGRDAGVAVSTDATNTSTIAGRLKYSVSYKTIDNSGDIVAQELDEDGSIVRDSDGLPTSRWVASEMIAAPDARRVFSYSDGGGGFPFSGSFSSLPSDVQASLKHGPHASRISNDSSFIDYLRGKDPVTDANGKLFRQRSSKIGAMVNPPSIYMGASRDFAYDLSGSVDGSTTYKAFVDSKATLPASLFVATNAGVVHNLDAKEGTELAAFMPKRSLKRMLNFANDAYTFEYTLDGPLSEHDIYDGKDWHHIAVGTGGRGEKLIYALRSPLHASDRIPDKEDFLWETGPTTGMPDEKDLLDSDDFKLGHITHPSRSGQTEDGTWVLVLNSGHYNGADDGEKHGLVVLDPMTGDLIRRIPLPGGYSAGRGLSGVTLVRNEDKRIVAAYAGDANGNLWRFDLRGKKDGWKVSYGKPLFTTEGNRPIYSAPAWQAHPQGGNIVVIATGMLLEESDISETKASNHEWIYGIWDPTKLGDDDKSPFTTAEPDDLLLQGIDTSTASVTDSSGTRTYNRTTKNQIDWTKHRGWKFALGHTHLGERSLDQIRNVGTSVFINTVVIAPQKNEDDEMCTASGLPLNYIYGLRAIDGASQYSFDVDGDGKLDNVSMVLIENGGYSRGVALANIFDGPVTNSIREMLGIDSGSGEAPPTPQKCTNVQKAALGTEEGAIRLGVYCPVAGWNRTQFQLSTPPKN